MIDLGFQADLGLRLLVAAVLGVAIGIEREIHGHPAGMRTHLLVSLGSAIFTELSIYGFGEPGAQGLDPSRIAAQIVSGIGFLGAGAILKEGATIKGLTTAASLWATAAIGLAAGAAQYGIGVAGTVIVIISLWPLNRIAERLHGAGRSEERLALVVDRLGLIGEVAKALTDKRVEIVGIQTERRTKHEYAIDFIVRRRTGSDLVGAIQAISTIEGVEVAGTTSDD